MHYKGKPKYFQYILLRKPKYFRKGGWGSMKPSYKKLQHLLMKEDINVSKLGEKINISPSTFSDWKSEKSFPKVDKLYLIANYFNVPIEYFLEDKE